MLQRIQTVYLLIAGLLAFAFSFIQMDRILTFEIMSIPGVLVFVSGLDSLLAISLFSNRKLQLKLVYLASTVLLLAFGIYLYLNLSVDFYLHLEFYLLLLAFVNHLLALRGIKKDEELIRSSNRLR
ncbi:MAG: DUF4293 family protein [Chitinophagales bacterium]|nr:DUF4293 family protein [Chitinophagales bacterium]